MSLLVTLPPHSEWCRAESARNWNAQRVQVGASKLRLEVDFGEKPTKFPFDSN